MNIIQTNNSESKSAFPFPNLPKFEIDNNQKQSFSKMFQNSISQNKNKDDKHIDENKKEPYKVSKSSEKNENLTNNRQKEIENTNSKKDLIKSDSKHENEHKITAKLVDNAADKVKDSKKTITDEEKEDLTQLKEELLSLLQEINNKISTKSDSNTNDKEINVLKHKAKEIASLIKKLSNLTNKNEKISTSLLNKTIQDIKELVDNNENKKSTIEKKIKLSIKDIEKKIELLPQNKKEGNTEESFKAILTEKNDKRIQDKIDNKYKNIKNKANSKLNDEKTVNNSKIQVNDISSEITKNNLNSSNQSEEQTNNKEFSFNNIKSDIKATTSTQNKNPFFRNQLDDMISKAKIVTQNGSNGKLTMKMNPERLGEVNINLGLKNGIINGKFLVDSLEAKTLLENNLENIRQELEKAGIFVGELRVDIDGKKRNFSESQNEKKKNLNYGLSKTLSDQKESNEFETNSTELRESSLNLVI